MNYKFIFYLLFLIILSCNNNKDLKNWETAQKLYNNKDLDNCLIHLDSIISISTNAEYITKSLFLISEIYLNEYKEYDIAINFLDRILWDYPKSTLSNRALFTKAYINSNYIQSYTVAKELYNQFLDKYPNDDLAPSVKYELEELDKKNNTINRLLNK